MKIFPRKFTKQGVIKSSLKIKRIREQDAQPLILLKITLNPISIKLKIKTLQWDQDHKEKALELQDLGCQVFLEFIRSTSKDQI